MKMIVQSQSCFDRLGVDTSLDMFADAGFDAIDYSMFHPLDSEWMNQPMGQMLDFYRELRRKAEAKGLPFRQMHAPFVDLYADDEMYEKLFPYLVKSMYVCAALDARHIVVHPQIDRRNYGNEYREESRRKIIDSYARLIPAAKEAGVMVCVENMYTLWPDSGDRAPMFLSSAEDLIDVVDELNGIAGEKLFGVCLDIGHANLYDNAAPRMIRILGDYITCLHIHDNDLQDDRHIMPYLGYTDIDGTFRALREIGYQGDLTLECEFSIQNLPLTVVPHMLKVFESTGRHLMSIVQGEIK